MKVKLSYFKLSGKWYADGEYEARDGKPLYELWADVRTLLQAGRLPGLIEGHSAFIVSVSVPDHPHNHPHLIIPRSDNED